MDITESNLNNEELIKELKEVINNGNIQTTKRDNFDRKQSSAPINDSNSSPNNSNKSSDIQEIKKAPAPSAPITTDLINEDEEELFKKFLDPQATYHPIAFQDPLEMLEVLFAGTESIYLKPWEWQKEEVNRINSIKCSKEHPLRYLLSASNGSGKDAFINSPISTFQAACKIRSRTILTTASYQQLSLQTEAHIRTIANRANYYFQSNNIKLFNDADKLFIIKKGHIVCTQTGSEIIMFVTDEAGRAEGYHPFSDYPQGEVTIIINEAKTVPDIIFQALSRCTYSKWLEVSSIGGTTGKHYSHWRDAIEYPEPYVTGKFYKRCITSYDCPHISSEKIENDKIEYGESSAIFRSMHLSLPTSLDEQVVIRREAMEQAILFPTKKLKLGVGKRAGLDLAGGGDENALYVFDENECIGNEKFRAKDTAEVTVPLLIDLFKKYSLKGDETYADDGGIGQAIIDGLRRSGYNLNRVLMQSAPSAKGQYGNRGAELWFRFGQFFQYIIYPEGDEKLINQLTSRYYTQHKTQGKLILEAKKEARAKGHGSPDRADACVLAWTGITVHTFLAALGLEAAPLTRKNHLLGAKEVAKNFTPSRHQQQMNIASLAELLQGVRNSEQETKKWNRFNNPGKLLRSLI